MRIWLGLIAGLLALAWVVAPSWSEPVGEKAKTPGATTAVSRPVDATATVSIPSGTTDPNGFRRPTKVVDASPLTAAECAHHDGEVVVDYAGVCASGFFCRTEDNNGKKHRVCLSKVQ